MNKNQKIKLINKDTFEFEVLTDLKKGDRFSLNEYFDSAAQVYADIKSSLSKTQEQYFETEIQSRIKEAIENYKGDLSIKINELNKEIDHQKEIRKKDIEQAIITEQNKNNLLINDKDNEIENLTKNIENINKTIHEKIDIAVKNKQNELNIEILKKDKEINELTNKISYLNDEQKIALKEKELEIQEKFNKDIKKLENEIQILKDKNSELTRSKKILGTKNLGNELEDWCAQEMKLNLENNLDDLIVERDSTKNSEDKQAADFIVTIRNDYKILLEMKTELEDSTHKKTNWDHTKKLIKDASQRHISIAILVTEIHDNNDPFIFKKPSLSEEQKKANVEIFWCRPDGLVFLISIIRLLYIKYNNIVNNELVFKQKEEFLNNFNLTKQSIYDTFNKISNKVSKIKDNADKIKKSAESILEDIDIILDTHMETIKNKLDRIDIVAKKIDKIEKKPSED